MSKLDDNVFLLVTFWTILIIVGFGVLVPLYFSVCWDCCYFSDTDYYYSMLFYFVACVFCVVELYLLFRISFLKDDNNKVEKEQ